MRGFALQRLLPKVNRVQPKGFTLQSNGTAFAVRNPRNNKKQAVSTACFFGGDAGFVANKVCVITEQRRTLCFFNRIVASDNAHSFACVLLFPTGTQYPAGSPEYRISDRLRSTICCKQQCYAFVRQIAQSLAMSAALDFRKCKRLLLSSLAVSRVPGFTLQSNGTAFAVQNPRFGIKKNSLCCSFFVFNIRKSYTKDIAIMLRFYKKRKKNQEYYPGLFSYYICTEYPTEQVI